MNYQSPEVINGEDQTYAVDTWALGNILFKMLVGAVPFKGTNPFQVYKDIKSRNINWPPQKEVSKMMSEEAYDLINRIIQIEPKLRLGHNLESIKILKTHPFFKGIDFNKVSKKGYDGAKALAIEQLKKYHTEQNVLGDNNRDSVVPSRDVDLGSRLLLKGNLIKINWWGNR